MRDDAVGFESALALARMDGPPPELATWILRIGATREFFVHPELMPLLAHLAPLQRDQVAELQKLKQRFDIEVAKPPLDRSVNIYNDSVYRATLDKTLDLLTPGEG